MGFIVQKMFLYAIYWQISLIRTLPEEWYHLSEILLAFHFGRVMEYGRKILAI